MHCWLCSEGRFDWFWTLHESDGKVCGIGFSKICQHQKRPCENDVWFVWKDLYVAVSKKYAGHRAFRANSLYSNYNFSAF